MFQKAFVGDYIDTGRGPRRVEMVNELGAGEFEYHLETGEVLGDEDFLLTQVFLESEVQ